MVKMLQRCRERNLKLNPGKMIFRRQEVPFVGHILTSNGLKMQPARGTAIADMNTSEDVAAERRFLGMANYVSRFIPNLAEIAAPLRQLARKDTE